MICARLFGSVLCLLLLLPAGLVSAQTGHFWLRILHQERQVAPNTPRFQVRSAAAAPHWETTARANFDSLDLTPTDDTTLWFLEVHVAVHNLGRQWKEEPLHLVLGSDTMTLYLRRAGGGYFELPFKKGQYALEGTGSYLARKSIAPAAPPPEVRPPVPQQPVYVPAKPFRLQAQDSEGRPLQACFSFLAGGRWVDCDSGGRCAVAHMPDRRDSILVRAEADNYQTRTLLLAPATGRPDSLAAWPLLLYRNDESHYRNANGREVSWCPATTLSVDLREAFRPAEWDSLLCSLGLEQVRITRPEVPADRRRRPVVSGCAEQLLLCRVSGLPFAPDIPELAALRQHPKILVAGITLVPGKLLMNNIILVTYRGWDPPAELAAWQVRHHLTLLDSSSIGQRLYRAPDGAGSAVFAIACACSDLSDILEAQPQMVGTLCY